MEIVNLGSIAKIDISNVDKKIKENDSPVTLCNFVDVYKNWAITLSLLPNLMKSTANNNQLERFSISKGKVAITKDSETRDDIGVSTYIADDIPNTVLGYHCALISPDSKVLCGKYLNIVFHSYYAKKYFAMNASGSGQRYTLTNSIIANFPVPLPSIEIQKRIGDIFSYIDRRIQINKEICFEIESMARTIFDYWFMQFDFPGENSKPYRSSGGKMVWCEELKRAIPKGWKVQSIGELITSDRGISYSTKTITGDGVPMINLASFTPTGEYKGDGIKTFSGKYSSEKALKPFDLVMCNTQQTAINPKKDIIGRSLLIPDIFDGDVVSSHHVTRIQPHNNLLKCYLHYLFNTEYFHRYIAAHTNGTNILGLLFNGVEEFCIPVPDDVTLERFDSIVINNEKMKSKIIKENQQLYSLRDWLLPMLINGQIGFKEEKEETTQIKISGFEQWLANQGFAARGGVDMDVLRDIYEAMDDDDK